jgi:hypothetical protein
VLGCHGKTGPLWAAVGLHGNKKNRIEKRRVWAGARQLTQEGFCRVKTLFFFKSPFLILGLNQIQIGFEFKQSST